ncbi:MAG: hypothetical protein EBT98_07200 [Opitutaceae bacterium]|jgi:anti-sigma factor RsiW|nr:hypothetical protein [Opitutaceae bacterium]
MKDHRFIELVNLYIDRQITAAETAELEAEIQGHPRRRATYQQYCRIHRATLVIGEGFRPQAAGQPAQTAFTKNRSLQRSGEQRQRKVRWSYYVSGLAAAACFGLIFIRLNSKPTANVNLLASASVPLTQTEISSPGAESVIPQIVPAHEKNTYVASEVPARPLQRSLLSRQSESIQYPSLFADEVFSTKQIGTLTNPRTFRGLPTPTSQLEFTAFQFQR